MIACTTAIPPRDCGPPRQWIAPLGRTPAQQSSSSDSALDGVRRVNPRSCRPVGPRPTSAGGRHREIKVLLARQGPQVDETHLNIRVEPVDVGGRRRHFAAHDPVHDALIRGVRTIGALGPGTASKLPSLRWVSTGCRCPPTSSAPLSTWRRVEADDTRHDADPVAVGCVAARSAAGSTRSAAPRPRRLRCERPHPAYRQANASSSSLAPRAVHLTEHRPC